MKLLDKQVARELIGPLVFGVAAFTSVFFAGTYILQITEWVMNGMPITTALEVVLLVLPDTIKYTLPMSTLLAVLLGVGRLSADSEIVSLFASGISLYRIAVPIIIMGILITGASITFNEFVGPYANFRMDEIKATLLKQQVKAGKSFTFFDDSLQMLVRVEGEVDVDSGTLNKVMILKYEKGVPRIMFVAKKAIWAGLTNEEHKFRWRLEDGWQQSLGGGSGAYMSFGNLDTREVEIRKTPKQIGLFQKILNTRYTDQLSFTQISAALNYLRKHPDLSQDKIRRMEVDRWNRIAVPMSSLVFAMLAAPLGIRPHRSSSSVGLGLSVLLILLYYIAWNYTCNVAARGTLDPAVGAFAANALGIAASIALLKKASK
jgi:lipopolysaccharide export system permease protein